MEFNLAAVEEAAKKENGWHVIAVHKARHQSGTLPSGIVCFVRGVAPFEDRRCGTALWSRMEATGNVLFTQGHYDMNRDEALEDFLHRVIRIDLGGEVQPDTAEVA
jgi:hypothetical protein